MAITAEDRRNTQPITNELLLYLEYEAEGYVETKYEIDNDTVYIWPKFFVNVLDDNSYVRAEILDLFHKIKKEYCKQYIDQKPKVIKGSFTEALKNRNSGYSVMWCQFEDQEDSQQQDVKMVSIEEKEI